MTRPEQIAAALERWEKLKTDWFDSSAFPAGDELARLLRAANPPAGAERATEPVYTDDTPLMLAYREADEPATPAVGEDAGADCECTCAAELAEKARALLANVARLEKRRELSRQTIEMWTTDCKAAEKERDEARADVARLKQAFDDEEKAGDLHRSINRRAALALGKPQEGERSSWHDIPEEIAALRAALEAKKP